MSEVVLFDDLVELITVIYAGKFIEVDTLILERDNDGCESYREADRKKIICRPMVLRSMCMTIR